MQDDFYGVCLPTGERDCAGNAAVCQPLSSLSCINDGPNARCYFRCATHADCPGPYQTCQSDYCAFSTCHATESGPGLCLAGSHCEDGMCIAD